MKEKYKLLEVKTWHLKYEGVIPELDDSYKAEQWFQPDCDEYLSLYRRVGSQWGWTGRLFLSHELLKQKLESPLNEVWLFSDHYNLFGYFEIDRSEPGKAEIVYFGLLPEMVGKGYGKPFLDAAIVKASGRNRDIVWLHTCEYDHPKALQVYLKAGFVIEKETLEHEYYPELFIRK